MTRLKKAESPVIWRKDSKALTARNIQLQGKPITIPIVNEPVTPKLSPLVQGLSRLRNATQSAAGSTPNLNEANSSIKERKISRQVAVDLNDFLERPRSNTWNGEDDPKSPAAQRKTSIFRNSGLFKRKHKNEEEKFKNLKSEDVEKVVNETFQKYCSLLSNASSADPNEACVKVVKAIEQALQDLINKYQLRCKMIVTLYLGEVRNEGVKLGCQYNWNPESDYFAMATHEQDNLFATAFAYLIQF